MTFTLGFLVGGGIGLVLGFLVCSLLTIASESDDRTEQIERGMATRQEMDKHGGGNCAAE